MTESRTVGCLASVMFTQGAASARAYVEALASIAPLAALLEKSMGKIEGEARKISMSTELTFPEAIDKIRRRLLRDDYATNIMKMDNDFIDYAIDARKSLEDFDEINLFYGYDRQTFPRPENTRPKYQAVQARKNYYRRAMLSQSGMIEHRIRRVKKDKWRD